MKFKINNTLKRNLIVNSTDGVQIALEITEDILTKRESIAESTFKIARMDMANLKNGLLTAESHTDNELTIIKKAKTAIEYMEKLESKQQVQKRARLLENTIQELQLAMEIAESNLDFQIRKEQN